MLAMLCMPANREKKVRKYQVRCMEVKRKARELRVDEKGYNSMNILEKEMSWGLVLPEFNINSFCDESTAVILIAVKVVIILVFIVKRVIGT